MIDPRIRLRRAIHLGDILLVKRIIHARPDLLKNPDYDDKSNSSLHLVARLGLVEIAQVLLDAGHDSTEISLNTEHETPLMIAISSSQLSVARLLIARCARCIPWRNRAGLDALCLAASVPSSAPLLPLLIPYISPVLSRDHKGNTALHHASAAGSLKALRVLLEAGADPSARNAALWTPIAYSQTVQAEVYFKQLVAEFEGGVEGGRSQSYSQAQGPGQSAGGAVLARVASADTSSDGFSVLSGVMSRDRGDSEGSAAGAGTAVRRKFPAVGANAGGVRLVPAEDAERGMSLDGGSGGWTVGGGGSPRRVHRQQEYFDGTRMRAGSGE